MAEGSRRPRRFRRRLTAAFVLVAALSAGILATVTYAIASNNRWRNIEESSRAEANVALALAPRTLDDSTFDRYIRASELRTGAETVAVTAAGQEFSTAEAISPSMVDGSRPVSSDGDMRGTEVVLGGRSYYVYTGNGPNDVRYTFLFPLDQVQVGLAELRTTLVETWVILVVIALAVGALVARRTLRPVREAAEAATAIADGTLDTRLTWSGDDEFSALAQSFNRMADALQSRIGELAGAAERERQFTADAAHDLRTPLTGLSVTCSLLRERIDELPSDLHRVVELHTRDIDRLRTLVLELLELYRIDSGTEPVDFEDLDVALALGATVDSLVLSDDATIEVAVPPGLVVFAERARFKRIMSNVILNGVAHGGGRVDIKARLDGGDVEIAITDDGEGIAPEDVDAVFDRFFKGDRSRAAGGSGLGLAIAREQARVQGGDLTVSNVPGAGACFTLRLPRGVADDV